MNDDRFDRFLSEQGRTFRQPPDTPREQMWARIEERRRERRVPTGAPAWLRWGGGLAAAALLVMGFALGRFSTAPDVDPGLALAADQSADSIVFSFAAADHLRQTDTFLAAFQVEARSGVTDPDLGEWALELLTTTRLMMDSPAGGDLGLRELLEDLELVLVEIAGFAERRSELELELIETGLDEGAVLLRLRAQLSRNAEAFRAAGAS